MEASRASSSYLRIPLPAEFSYLNNRFSLHLSPVFSTFAHQQSELEFQHSLQLLYSTLLYLLYNTILHYTTLHYTTQHKSTRHKSARQYTTHSTSQSASISKTSCWFDNTSQPPLPIRKLSIPEHLWFVYLLDYPQLRISDIYSKSEPFSRFT